MYVIIHLLIIILLSVKVKLKWIRLRSGCESNHACFCCYRCVLSVCPWPRCVSSFCISLSLSRTRSAWNGPEVPKSSSVIFFLIRTFLPSELRHAQVGLHCTQESSLSPVFTLSCDFLLRTMFTLLTLNNSTVFCSVNLQVTSDVEDLPLTHTHTHQP